jgi:hypothetical protein
VLILGTSFLLFLLQAPATTGPFRFGAEDNTEAMLITTAITTGFYVFSLCAYAASALCCWMFVRRARRYSTWQRWGLLSSAALVLAGLSNVVSYAGTCLCPDEVPPELKHLLFALAGVLFFFVFSVRPLGAMVAGWVVAAADAAGTAAVARVSASVVREEGED